MTLASTVEGADRLQLKCISLWQPWASLIGARAKTIETRSRGWAYRGPLGIHATKSMVMGVPGAGARALELSIGRFVVFYDSPGWYLKDTTLPGSVSHLPLGALVAVADLVDVLPIVEVEDEAGVDYDRFVRVDHAAATLEIVSRSDGLTEDVSDQLPFGDYRTGRFAWLLGAARRLAVPLSMSGRQGPWLHELSTEDLEAA